MNNKTDFDSAELFAKELNQFLTNYIKDLNQKYTRQTVQKHQILIDDWISYITLHEGICRFNQITVKMVNSSFRSFLYSADPYNKTDYPVSFCKSCLIGFFSFLNANGGCVPDKIIKSLEK